MGRAGGGHPGRDGTGRRSKQLDRGVRGLLTSEDRKMKDGPRDAGRGVCVCLSVCLSVL